MREVHIVDYGVGNLLSVSRALEECGAKVIISSDPKKISSAKKIILPGVGAYEGAIQKIKKLGLDQAIFEAKESNAYLLGICLGMQLMFTSSEEFGIHDGLNLIGGSVRAIPRKNNSGELVRVPNVGWYRLAPNNRSEIIFKNNLKILIDDYFYFTHSFMVYAQNPEVVESSIDYMGVDIPAVINTNHLYGCQFHPEKSGKAGLRLLSNFLDL